MELPDLEHVRERLGHRYEVERFFQRGGMGSVFLGRHRTLGSAVAIKVLHALIGEEGADLVRFQREATLAANLSHPNIVPVFEFELASDLAYLVMPFVEGQTLAAHLRERGRLDYHEVRELLAQVAAALGFAHQRGIVHRDVKPSNILLESATGRWLVTDFGIAQAARPGDTKITRAGEVVGTPAYMAPEQATGMVNVDARADLYALAAVAYEALAGEPIEILQDADEAARALGSARPDVPHRVVKALTTPLALDRERRPASVARWLDMLAAAEGRRAGRWWWAAGAATALLAIGGWWLARTPELVAASRTVAILPLAVQGDVRDLELSHALTRAFEDQLRWLPEYRIVSSSQLQRVLSERFSVGTPFDSLARFVGRAFGASEVLSAVVEFLPQDRVRIRVDVRAGAAGQTVRSADATGSLDSLSALVSGLVLESFAMNVARELTGWSAALPYGLNAFREYVAAEAAFRSGAYEQAADRYGRVLALDSTFAMAEFKRMLCEVLRLRPTQATTSVRTALESVRRFRDRLDPTTRALLEGYELLVTEGDLHGAQEAFQRIVERHPNAVDAWFVLGYLRFAFAPLLGQSRTAARYAFERAHALDPNFAAPIVQLARIAVIQENEGLARRYMAAYRQIDSVSVWAELTGMVDSLLYVGGRAPLAVLASFEQRPSAALETIAMAAGELSVRPTARGIAHDAIAALWNRAATREDRAIAFRLRMASMLGTGREATADSLLRAARRIGAPQEEVDQWLLLTAVTGTASLGDLAARQEAARRLLADTGDDPTTAWLAARWFRGRDRSAVAGAVRRLDALRRNGAHAPLARSLRLDLDALDRLAAGDTAGALERWRVATARYSIKDVLFGPVGSLWPLRLAVAQVAARRGDVDGVVAETNSFQLMAGFNDQVAWPDALALRAEALAALGERNASRATYAALLAVLDGANGARAALRDSVAAILTVGEEGRR